MMTLRRLRKLFSRKNVFISQLYKSCPHSSRSWKLRERDKYIKQLLTRGKDDDDEGKIIFCRWPQNERSTCIAGLEKVLAIWFTKLLSAEDLGNIRVAYWDHPVYSRDDELLYFTAYNPLGTYIFNQPMVICQDEQ